MTATIDICQLCLCKKELKSSHIIPSFVYKWLRETAALPSLRYGKIPNKRIQDGEKRALLCQDCELLLSQWEKTFSENIFIPQIQDSTQQIEYHQWMLKFSVSVVWRALVFLLLDGVADYPLIDEAKLAMERWRRFLLGEYKNPNIYQIHAMPFDLIESANTKDKLLTNINRYLMRAVDMDVAHSEKGPHGFVYVKMCHILLIGFLTNNESKDWRWKNTLIHVNKGCFGGSNRQYVMPQSVFKFILDRAHNVRRIMKSISQSQRDKSAKQMNKNIERVEKSETMRLLDYDVKMFGDDAFEDKDN